MSLWMDRKGLQQKELRLAWPLQLESHVARTKTKTTRSIPEPTAMKKILAVLALLAISSMTLSTAHAACGSNTSRNSSTRAPAGGGTAGGTGSATGAAGAGVPR